MLGLRSAIENRLAGLETSLWSEPTGTARPILPNMELNERLAIAASGRGTRSSRVVCLDSLRRADQTDAFLKGLKQLRSEGLQSPGLTYLEVEACLLEGRFKRALELCLDSEDLEMWGEQCAHRVSQLARVCQEARVPQLALPILRWWTESFQNVPDAGDVWMQRCLCAVMDPDAPRGEAREALARAHELLEDRSDLTAIMDRLGSEDS